MSSKKEGKRPARQVGKIQVLNKVQAKSKKPKVSAGVDDLVRRNVDYVNQNKSFMSPYTIPEEDIDYSMACRNAMTQYVDPARLPEAVLAPDSAPNHRSVRRFVSRFAIASGDAGCGAGFTLIVTPSLSSPIVFTGGNTLLPAAALGPLEMDGLIHSDAANVISDSVVQATDLAGNKAAVQLVPLTHTTTYMGMYLRSTASAAANSSLIISAEGDSTRTAAKLSVYRALTADVAWTLMQTVQVSDTSVPVSIGFGTETFDQLAFAITDGGGKVHKLKFNIRTTGGALLQLSATAATDLGRGIVTEALESATGGRLVGMSVLVSNTSPQTGDGGTMTAARVPRTVSPFASTAVILARSPPHDFYQGPAKLGAYAWWLPRETSSQTFLDRGECESQLSNDCYLFAKLEGWGGPNGSSVVVTVNYVVEFYISNQLYEKRLTLPRLPMWDQYMHAMALAPAATCNPEHAEIFRNILNSAKNFADGAYDHYGRHKAFYDTAYKILLGLAG